jgi:lipase chaperone LimK
VKRRHHGSAALVVALLGLWLLASRVQLSSTDPAPAVANTTPAPAMPTSAATTLSPPVAVEHEHPVPPTPLAQLLERWQASSQRGSAIDGELSFHDDGRLRVDLGLRRLFDYALSLQGEFSLAEIRQLLHHWISASHDAGIADAVLAQFERYLALKQDEAQLAGISDLNERLAALMDLREQHFGADADALFGDDEAYAIHTLQRLALLRDRSLSADQRAAALAELDARRPEAERVAERDSLSAVIAAEHERQLAEQAVAPEQVQEERAALWGEDAAARLAALDAERAAWDARLADYAAARQRVLGDLRLSAAAREAALAALRQRGFSDAEQRRIASLEAIGALPGG